jgi:hypothetical protein
MTRSPVVPNGVNLGGRRWRGRGQVGACAPRAVWYRTIPRLNGGCLLQGSSPLGSPQMSVYGRATNRGRREKEVLFGSPAPNFTRQRHEWGILVGCRPVSICTVSRRIAG